jgi:hypothetical protein
MYHVYKIITVNKCVKFQTILFSIFGNTNRLAKTSTKYEANPGVGAKALPLL